MTSRTRADRTWVTVDWAGPVQARTLYYGADLVHVEDPVTVPAASEEFHTACTDGIRGLEP
ncbi:hypothetical protein [Streptomyces vilmorinianum]|uniref:hypothetical protein n=1 Tax=Streptomyces vilmorinianum TaxID=3051092 RepID=UPI0010FAFB2D|nr:hypothetical protein [Streptomyces vilmorinianum]